MKLMSENIWLTSSIKFIINVKTYYLVSGASDWSVLYISKVLELFVLEEVEEGFKVFFSLTMLVKNLLLDLACHILDDFKNSLFSFLTLLPLLLYAFNALAYFLVNLSK